MVKIFFLKNIKVVRNPVGRSWEQKSLENQFEKRCRNRDARKPNCDRFFVDFGAILAFQNGAKTFQNRCWKGIKIFDQFLKASWNAIFSTKRRQDARRPPVLESAWRNARVAWGGLRRGKTDVQTPRTLALEDWLWKDSEGPGSNHLARRPELGGGSLRAFRRAYSGRPISF